MHFFTRTRSDSSFLFLSVCSPVRPLVRLPVLPSVPSVQRGCPFVCLRVRPHGASRMPSPVNPPRQCCQKSLNSCSLQLVEGKDTSWKSWVTTTNRHKQTNKQTSRVPTSLTNNRCDTRRDFEIFTTRWPLYQTVISDRYIWPLYLTVISDRYIWPLYLTVIPDRYIDTV